MQIYLNNAATTYPKPPSVIRAVADFMERGGANFSRGSASDRDLATMDVVIDCREKLAEFFGAPDSALVTFTANVTESLNTVLKGFVRPSMRVLSTSMEHNSVVRPLRSLEKNGVEVEFISCDEDGFLRMDDLKRALSEKTDLFVTTHASNVCGTVLDLPAIAELCAARSVPLVVDAAQTAGYMKLDVAEHGVAALCFTGHKGLFGPQGTGGIVWSRDFVGKCEPFIEGGTGSFSHEETQPDALPDKFESGTLNLPGIAGLREALEFIASTGLDNIAEREDKLGNALLSGLRSIRGLTLYGPADGEKRVPVYALNFDNIDNARAAHILSTKFGVETRPGLHCSPLAHKILGSFPQGALRLSPGYFNTEEEIEYTLDAIKKLSEDR